VARRLPDRSPLVPGLRGAWFLFRQPWMVGPALVALAGIGVALAMMSRSESVRTEDLSVLAVFAPIVAFGFAALTGLPGFMLVRLFRTPLPVEAPDGEREIERWSANHFLGDEGRGGKLLLSEGTLLFVPHRFNVQLSELRIPLRAITSVAWRKIVQPASGLVVAGTVVVEAGGAEQTFVVRDAEAVAERIEKALPAR
jgi:hypothetical protein